MSEVILVFSLGLGVINLACLLFLCWRFDLHEGREQHMSRAAVRRMNRDTPTRKEARG